MCGIVVSVFFAAARAGVTQRSRAATKETSVKLASTVSTVSTVSTEVLHTGILFYPYLYCSF